jgi:multicomponent Na+:H+ antiporter subunit C
MNLILALVIGVIFGAGTYLTLKRDLIRMVVGISLISSAVNLFIIAASISRGAPPIHPRAEDVSPPDGVVFSDPLTQALALTAIVIGFGITTLLLVLVYRTYTIHHSLDEEVLHEDEKQEVAHLEQGSETV